MHPESTLEVNAGREAGVFARRETKWNVSIIRVSLCLGPSVGATTTDSRTDADRFHSGHRVQAGKENVKQKER